MEITNPRIEIDEDGYSFLVVRYGEWTARVFIEQPLRRFGLLYLGSEFEDRVPALFVPEDPPGRPAPEAVHGFSNDGQLLAWYDRMRLLDRAHKLEEGPLS